MKTLAFAVPILPGKTEAWKKWMEELHGLRKQDFLASRKRFGVAVERVYLQNHPGGDLAIISVEGEDVEKFPQKLAASKEPFDVWLQKMVLEIYGVDLSKKGPVLPQFSLELKGN